MKHVYSILAALVVGVFAQANSANACIPSITTDTVYNVHMIGRRELNVDISGFSRASVMLYIPWAISTRTSPTILGDDGVAEQIQAPVLDGFVLHKYDLKRGGNIVFRVITTEGVVEQKVNVRMLATPRSAGC